ARRRVSPCLPRRSPTPFHQVVCPTRQVGCPTRLESAVVGAKAIAVSSASTTLGRANRAGEEDANELLRRRSALPGRAADASGALLAELGGAFALAPCSELPRGPARGAG